MAGVRFSFDCPVYKFQNIFIFRAFLAPAYKINHYSIWFILRIVRNFLMNVMFQSFTRQSAQHMTNLHTLDEQKHNTSEEMSNIS